MAYAFGFGHGAGLGFGLGFLNLVGTLLFFLFIVFLIKTVVRGGWRGGWGGRRGERPDYDGWGFRWGAARESRSARGTVDLGTTYRDTTRPGRPPASVLPTAR
mgnify:CR=1 FL=1